MLFVSKCVNELKELTSFVDTLKKRMTVSVFLWPKVLEYIRQKITAFRLDNIWSGVWGEDWMV